MFNKESCRSCGKILVPISMCNYCKEHISWICNKCQRVEDVSHKHDRTHDTKNTYLDVKNSIESGIIHLVSNGK
ncbi:MAG: hypothetical protein M3P28_06995 [Thermoproteota archaeon]|jgi:phage FluMu protein Com|nr:hypothetical protein [Thermoproteota archaeon]MDW0155557.1 hypothetical protein [Nitrososphaeraceae archaeon]